MALGLTALTATAGTAIYRATDRCFHAQHTSVGASVHRTYNPADDAIRCSVHGTDGETTHVQLRVWDLLHH